MRRISRLDRGRKKTTKKQMRGTPSLETRTARSRQDGVDSLVISVRRGFWFSGVCKEPGHDGNLRAHVFDGKMMDVPGRKTSAVCAKNLRRYVIIQPGPNRTTDGRLKKVAHVERNTCSSVDGVTLHIRLLEVLRTDDDASERIRAAKRTVCGV